MAFVKVVKNKAYFKRFQVKYRRRREGKTDYQARRALVCQDKNKYNSPKYRLVVRFTNKTVITQIVYSKVQGDVVVCSAYSPELKNFGINFGLTNYAAAYATGLLLARRLLKSVKLDQQYQGKLEADGQVFNVEAVEDGPRPFKAFLDIGLNRTTTGARIFAVLKGAVDGGLNVPHNEKRFVGYNKEKGEFDADVLRKYLYGGHVADYMRQLEAEDKDKFSRLFASYLKKGLTADKIEGVYKAAHKKIRSNPERKARAAAVDVAKLKQKVKKDKALSYEQRAQRTQARKATFLASLE